jgi:hypothetical protein
MRVGDYHWKEMEGEHGSSPGASECSEWWLDGWRQGHSLQIRCRQREDGDPTNMSLMLE